MKIALSQSTLKIRSSVNLSHILQTTVNEVRSLLGGQRVIIYRIHFNRTEVLVEGVEPFYSSMANTDFSLISLDIASYRQHQVEIIDNIDTAELSEEKRDFWRLFQIKTLATIPIYLHQNLVSYSK